MPQWDDMQNSSQLCWLKVKVTIEGHQFEPWILRPLHCHSDCLVKFGSNVHLSVEPRTQWCRLKVKVTIEGHSSLSCSLHISWTFWKIFMKLWSNVCFSEAMCRTHKHADLSSRSQLKVTSLNLEFHVHSISPEPFERYLLNLGQMFTLVRWCAEPITQQCRLKVKVTVEGHQFEPWILRPLHCLSVAGNIAVLQTALFIIILFFRKK